MSIEIRPAEVADVPQLQAIYAHHVLHGLATYEIDPPSLDEMRARYAQITEDGFPFFVATEAGRVLGYAYANHFRTRPGYRYTVEDSIYLRPGAAGRGIGRALLERLIAECERRGFRQMLAVIGDSDNAASIRVHRACGFTNMAVFAATGFKFERWVDTVIMQRVLGEGSGTLPG
jgi:phosphinothricin acetyltransferase